MPSTCSDWQVVSTTPTSDQTLSGVLPTWWGLQTHRNVQQVSATPLAPFAPIDISPNSPGSPSFISAQIQSRPGLKPTNPLLIRISLLSLRSSRHRLVAPLLLTVEREGEHIAVSWEQINEFGYGDTIQTATEDFQDSLAELYDELEHNAGTLGKDLAEVWVTLRQFVQKQ